MEGGSSASTTHDEPEDASEARFTLKYLGSTLVETPSSEEATAEAIKTVITMVRFFYLILQITKDLFIIEYCYILRDRIIAIIIITIVFVYFREIGLQLSRNIYSCRLVIIIQYFWMKNVQFFLTT